MKRKQVDDICLDKPSKEFCFGKIQEGYRRSKSSKDKKSRVLTYIISRDDLSEKDIRIIKEKVQELGEIEHSNITVPEKVIVSSSNVYFVFPFEKQRPFMEAYKEKMIKVPQFFEKLVECVKHLKTNDICPLEVLPETIRFDHKGNFEWHDLNCDFLLKKKFVTERIKEKKEEKTLKVHPPEVINKSDVKEIEPEKSLVYSMGVIFQKVGEKFSEVDEHPPLKKICQKFLEKMANKVAAERAELDEVLNFSWKSVVSKKVSFQKDKDGESDKGDESDKKKWKSKSEYKKGKFTDQEEEMLKHALCRYVKEHSDTEQELLRLITNYKDESVRGAWTKIAECLPDRSVQSCHQLIRNRFHPGNYKGAWTESEEKELVRLMDEKPRKWQEIADDLGRTPTNVRDKWKSMGEENHVTRNKGYWKPEEIIKLFRIIEQLTGVSLLSRSVEGWIEEERKEQKKSDDSTVSTKRRDALTKMFESKLCNYINYEEAKKIDYMTLEWTKISKKMKERSKDDCRNIWYRQIYNTISSGCDFTDEDDEILIGSILQQDPAHDHEINFVEIDNGRSPQENEIRWKQLSKAASTRALRSTSELVRLVRKYVRESKERKKQESFKIHKGAGNKNNELVQLYREEYND